MAYKTVLSIIGMHQKNRDLEVARDLCATSNSHLSVLLAARATAVPIGTYADVMSDAWYQERQAEAKKVAKRVEEIEEFVKSTGISADVTSEFAESGLVAESIGRRARYCDLILVGPSILADDDMRDYVTEGVLFRSGKPVLIAPENIPLTLTPKTVVVAWDGSLEAGRAAGLATPMLATAQDVRIVVVDPQTGQGAHGAEPGADAAAWLARHTTKVTVDRITSAGLSIGEAIQRHTADCGAGLIVMGGYGHSRLRERIFGGVTRSILDAPKVPLFMAH